MEVPLAFIVDRTLRVRRSAGGACRPLVLRLVCAIILAGILSSNSLAQGSKEEPPMLILPAPARVTIDGDLREWNKAGKIGPVLFDEAAAIIAAIGLGPACVESGTCPSSPAATGRRDWPG